MSVIDEKYLQLELMDEYLKDPLLMAVAWKKAHEYIRTTNWYADNFELDKSALNLDILCQKWIKSIYKTANFKNIELVPAPKTQSWEFSDDVCQKSGLVINDAIPTKFCLNWKPVDDAEVKLRPLAHIPIKEQSIMTLIMMCLANQVETLQGDPSTEFRHVHHKKVVSYGNRLYCSYDKEGKAEHSYGATTTYSKYFMDYRKFLRRPYYFASKQVSEISPDEEVYLIDLDLKQFFDLIERERLIEKIIQISCEKQGVVNLDSEKIVMKIFKLFKGWKWSQQAQKEYFLCKTDCIEEARNDGLPQGLVASGFLSNIYLMDFDAKMRDMIGKKIPKPDDGDDYENNLNFKFDINVIDYCRYVDDIRLVVVGPSRETFKSSPSQYVKSCVSSFFKHELSRLGLELNEGKTKIEVYRGKSTGISTTLESIQSKVSGPMSMEDADEHLNQLESLLVLSNTTLPNQSDNHCTINRLALVEKDIFDVREDTLKRFAANKITRMLASKRHFTARECNDDGQLIPGDWDYLQERLARRLMACWSRDPSIVLLLKKSLELFPSPKLLEPVLEQLDYLLGKSGCADIKENKQAALAGYCMSEIFRHAASVIHCKDQQTIPAQADINGFFEMLQHKAAAVIMNDHAKKPLTKGDRSKREFNIIKDQARFLLLIRMDSVLEKTTGDLEQDLIFKLAKGYRNISLSSNIDAQSVATCILLASQLVHDQKPVLRSTACLLSQNKVVSHDVLRYIVIQNTLFLMSLIRHARKLGYDWVRETEVVGIVNSIYGDARSSLKPLCEIKDYVPIFNIVSRQDNPFSNEIMALRLMGELLENSSQLHDDTSKRDVGMISLSQSKIRKLNGYSISPRFEDFNEKLELKIILHNPAVSVSSHIKNDNSDTAILQKVAFFIRSVLAGMTDPTGFGRVFTPRVGYRGIKSTQYKRQLSMMTTPESLVGENAQFSTWMTTLLAKLLRWPGVHVSNGGYKWPSQDLTIEKVKELISDRLSFLRENYCQSSGIPGLSELITPTWEKNKASLIVAMVQAKLPSVNDFVEHGIQLNTPVYRAKHRRHVARVASLVVGHIEAQHVEKTKNGRREQDIDLIVWPELAVHEDDIDILIHLSQKTHAIILAGLGFINQPCIKGPNNCAIWIVPRKHTGNRNEIKRYQGKQNMMEGERHLNIKPWRPYQLLLELAHPAYPQEPGFILTSSICFDSTDIALSADLRDKSNALLIPALNKDVTTFDTMVDALHYHMFQHVVLVNSGEFGGSYARAPYKEAHKRLIAHSTGNNQVTINTFEMNMFDFRRDGVGKSMRSGNELKAAPAGVNTKG